MTKAFLDVSVALGVNLVIVSPYLYMLLTGYPFLVTHSSQVLRSLPAHFLQVTLDQGAVFFLAATMSFGAGGSLLFPALRLEGFPLFVEELAEYKDRHRFDHAHEALLHLGLPRS